MCHPELHKATLDTRDDAQTDEYARTAKLSEVATLLTALTEQRESGPYSGKSLEWWKEAFIDAQLANLWFDEGDLDYLLSTVERMTGVGLPKDDSIWDVYRVAEEVAYYEDE